MPRRFRSKTLAVRVPVRGAGAPKSQMCLLRTCFCLPWTVVAGADTHRFAAAGRPNTISTGCEEERFDLRGYGRRLAQLKSDLRDALTEVQAHERGIAGPLVQARRLAREELHAGLKDILREVEQEKQTRGR